MPVLPPRIKFALKKNNMRQLRLIPRATTGEEKCGEKWAKGKIRVRATLFGGHLYIYFHSDDDASSQELTLIKALGLTLEERGLLLLLLLRGERVCFCISTNLMDQLRTFPPLPSPDRLRCP